MTSRVRNRNGLLLLGILRRCAIGIYCDWRRRRKNKRQSTLKDFYDDMHRFNNRHAFATITSPRRWPLQKSAMHHGSPWFTLGRHGFSFRESDNDFAN
jgi:hypothetical protein